jgi:hypothetical protein
MWTTTKGVHLCACPDDIPVVKSGSILRQVAEEETGNSVAHGMEQLESLHKKKVKIAASKKLAPDDVEGIGFGARFGVTPWGKELPPMLTDEQKKELRKAKAEEKKRTIAAKREDGVRMADAIAAGDTPDDGCSEHLSIREEQEEFDRFPGRALERATVILKDARAVMTECSYLSAELPTPGAPIAQWRRVKRMVAESNMIRYEKCNNSTIGPKLLVAQAALHTLDKVLKGFTAKPTVEIRGRFEAAVAELDHKVGREDLVLSPKIYEKLLQSTFDLLNKSGNIEACAELLRTRCVKFWTEDGNTRVKLDCGALLIYPQCDAKDKAIAFQRASKFQSSFVSGLLAVFFSLPSCDAEFMSVSTRVMQALDCVSEDPAG